MRIFNPFTGTWAMSGLFLLIFLSCKHPQQSTSKMETAQIHNLEELKANSGKFAEVFGTYIWVEARSDKEEAMGKEPAQGCQAALQLEDGTLVFLQPTWEAAAARPSDELKSYRDKAAVASGLVLLEGPAAPNGGNFIKGPCFVGPIALTDRGTWDALHGGKIDW